MHNTTPYPAPNDSAINWLNKLLDLLAETCDVPSALIMRAHPDQIEVFSSANTSTTPYKVGDKENLNCGLYCEYVMAHNSPLLIPDATQDPAWNNNPDIKLGMISYLGFPLVWPDGKIYGTICILDSKKNSYSPRIQGIVELFKNIVENHLALIYETYRTNAALETLKSNRKELAQAISLAVDTTASNSKIIKNASDNLSEAVEDLINLLKSPALQSLTSQGVGGDNLQVQLLQIINKVSALSGKLAYPQEDPKH